jgi:excisionase family DNA binding protein
MRDMGSGADSRGVITIDEAALLLRCSRATVSRMIEAGRLRAVRLGPAPGGALRIPRVEVEALLAGVETRG